MKIDIGRLNKARDWRCRAVMGRRRQRQMALAAKQARGRVHADPASAGEIDFGPGMEIGKITRRAFRTLERLDVGPQLYEIAGDETPREPEMAQNLDERPGRVAA
jgi:hypothetical protein